MSFAPYLILPGTARAAMEAWAAIFGATDLAVTTAADLPGWPGLPTDPAHVIHAQFTAGPGAPLMAADGPPGSQPGMVFHAPADATRAAVVFEALAEGGTVRRPLAPAPWSPAFGIVTDRWGVTWRITATPGP